MYAIVKLALAVSAAGLLLGTSEGQILKKLDVTDKTKKTSPLRVKGVDPAVTSLTFALKKKLNQFEGQIDIVGVVNNIGAADYKSGTGQQAAVLYEHVPGVKPRVVATRKFTNLKSGESFKMIFRVARWSTSTEFPADYSLQINYDPDIASDGNRSNDDVNRENNLKTLKGTNISNAVNKLLAAAK